MAQAEEEQKTFAITVTVNEPNFPFIAVALIVTVPAETPVTPPKLFTAATDPSLLDQTTFLSAASPGLTMAANVIESPT